MQANPLHRPPKIHWKVQGLLVALLARPCFHISCFFLLWRQEEGTVGRVPSKRKSPMNWSQFSVYKNHLFYTARTSLFKQLLLVLGQPYFVSLVTDSRLRHACRHGVLPPLQGKATGKWSPRAAGQRPRHHPSAGRRDDAAARDDRRRPTSMPSCQPSRLSSIQTRAPPTRAAWWHRFGPVSPSWPVPNSKQDLN